MASDSKCHDSLPLSKSYEPSTQNQQTQSEDMITEAHHNLKISVFVLIVSFSQLMESRRLFLKEKLIKFGGFKNITLIWIKEQVLVTRREFSQSA